MKKLKKLKVWQLVLALVLVVGLSVGFVLLVSFTSGSGKIVLGDEYRCEGEDCTLRRSDSEEVNVLMNERKTFVVFVGQDHCVTADALEDIVYDYVVEHGIVFLRLSFSEMKETALSESIKYYPSVGIVSKGQLVAFLRADSNEDAAAFSDYGEFSRWFEQYVLVEN